MINHIDNREAIASDLAACKKAFDSVNVPWVITDGIVLGYARDNDILPWDTDLDISVFVEITDTEWKILYEALRENGFNIANPNKIDFILGYRKIELNMWLFHKNCDYYESFPSTTPGLKFVEKALWYNRPQMIEFLGDVYPMPNYINNYLNCRYGNDWETNIVKSHDDFFVYKRGSRSDQNAWVTGRCGKQGTLWPKILKIRDNLSITAR